MIRLLMADDHAIVRDGWRQLFALAPDLKVVAEATSSAEVPCTSTAARPLHALLSGREFEVLRLLTTGLGVNAIAAQLAISDRTVSTHKARLLEKLNLSSMADLMRYAVQYNLPG